VLHSAAREIASGGTGASSLSICHLAERRDKLISWLSLAVVFQSIDGGGEMAWLAL
jgi:hypothetical protein